MHTSVRAAGLALGLVLAGCNVQGDVGYVEIRTVPASSRAPVLYLDAAKLGPVQKGTALLKQRTGTAKLSAEVAGGPPVPLCEVVVRKNRITTVTISALDRPPRCQCRNSAGKNVCIS